MTTMTSPILLPDVQELSRVRANVFGEWHLERDLARKRWKDGFVPCSFCRGRGQHALSCDLVAIIKSARRP